MWVGDIISSHSSYLYKCGVLDVICLLPGFTTTSLGINEIGSTLSFYIQQFWSLAAQNNCPMKHNVVAAVLLGFSVFACKNTEIEPEYMLSLDETSVSCEAGADELTVSLTCNGDWTLSTDEDDSWCEASAYKGSGDAEITFTVEPNPETDKRIIWYEFRCEDKTVDLRISQDGHVFSVSADPKELTFSAEDNTAKEVTVTSSDDWTLEVKADWCTTSRTSGKNGDKVSFTVKDYSETEKERTTTAVFSCGDKTFELEIVQGAKVYSISINPEELTFSAEDESAKEVTVTSSDDWTLEVEDDWCTPSATSGKNGDKVSFTVAGYSETEKNRSTTAIFTCGGKTFELEIIQGAKVYSISVEPEILVFNSTNPAKQTIRVSSSDNWSLEIEDDWCSASILSGKKNATITFYISEYNLSQDRETVATFYCGDKEAKLTIIQEKFSIVDIKSDALLNALIQDDVDKNNDGFISNLEAEAVTKLNLIIRSQGSGETYSFSEFTSLRRLEIYTTGNTDKDYIDIKGLNNLEYIGIHGSVYLCNISNNTALKEIVCGVGTLKSIEILNINECPNLVDLSCNDIQLRTLQIKGCQSLSKINCSDNYLHDIDISGCSSITELYCDNNFLDDIDLTFAESLEVLSCKDNAMTSINISSCTKLTSLNCNNNRFRELDLSNCVALTELYCEENSDPLDLNLENKINLKYVYCKNSSIMTINVKGCSSLTDLYCEENSIDNLDVSNCSSLLHLSCHNNYMTNLDMAGCSSIKELYCNDNQLSNLLLTDCTSIGHLECQNNDIITLDISNCVNLNYIDCSHNNISGDLNIQGFTQLAYCDCVYNNLENINANMCTALIELSCMSNNRLTKVDVSECSALSYLGCMYNSISDLNVNGCIALKELSCMGNRITTLDLSGCTLLEKLRCGTNFLLTLNLSKCENLNYISCENNNLTELDLRDCKYLSALYCQDNKLTKVIVPELNRISGLNSIITEYGDIIEYVN